MQAYQDLAFSYDRLTNDVDYNATVDFEVDDGGCLHYGKRVVRCKDCIWFSKTGYDEENAHEDDLNLHMGHCSVFRTGTQACRFCSYGERREGE